MKVDDVRADLLPRVRPKTPTDAASKLFLPRDKMFSSYVLRQVRFELRDEFALVAEEFRTSKLPLERIFCVDHRIE